MAHAEVPPFRNPLEHLGHTVREIPVWMGRHWKSLTLTLAALGGAGYVSIQLARPYTPDTQVKTTVPVSDILKPADPGADSEVVIPAVVPTEVTPAAGGASPTPEPPKPTPTFEPIKTPPSPTAEPTIEVKEAIDCGILSPEACAGGEHIEWNSPAGRKFRGIGFILKPGEKPKTPKALQASKVALKQPDTYNGVMIIAIPMDNSETYQYYGNFVPDNLGTKNLLEGETVGTIADSDLTVFQNQPYNFVFKGPDKFMERFSAITKNPPKIIDNSVPDKPATNVPIFFDISPRKGG